MRQAAALFDGFATAIEGLASRRGVAPVAAAFFLLACWGSLVPMLGASYSPDSYAYFILGRSLLSGEGFTSLAIRDFYLAPERLPPSRSFPPLHPLLVGVGNAAAHRGIDSAALIDLLLLAATFVVFLWLVREAAPCDGALVSLAFPLFFFLDEPYREEVAGGRAIPLAMLLFLGVLGASFRAADPTRRGWIVLTGALLGLVPLTRFDQAPFALLTVLFLVGWWRAQGAAWPTVLRAGGLLVAAAAIAYAPWGIRNLLRFGKVMASDNSLTALSTYPGIVQTTWWVGGMPPLLSADPGLWISQRMSYLKANWANLKSTSAYLSAYLLVLIPLAFRQFSPAQRLLTGLAAIHALTTVLLLSLTSYSRPRYFSIDHLTFWMLFFCAVAVLMRNLSRTHWRVAVMVAWVALLGELKSSRGLSLASGEFQRQLAVGSFSLVPPQENDLVRPQARVAEIAGQVASRKDPLVAHADAEAFSYATSERSIYLPSNALSRAALKDWMDRWHPDAIVAPEDWYRQLGIDTSRGRQVAPYIVMAAADLL